MADNSNNEFNSSSQQGSDLKSNLNFTKTVIDRLAVIIIDILGSMPFLISCVVIVTVWICWNTHVIPGVKAFDPFPFPTLEMSVSIFAIILSVSVLINQNRQGRIEKVRRQVEFEINVRAEHEITKILSLIHEMHQNMGLDTKHDQELEQMKEKTDISEIHQTVDQKQSEGESLTMNRT